MKQKALKIIQNRVVANMLGPGADGWGDPDTELLSASPIVRYQTGILFPHGYLTSSSVTSEDQEIDSENELMPEIDFGSGRKEKPAIERDDDENENESRFTQDLSTSAFYPDSIGLSFSLPQNSPDFNLIISGGLYRIPKSNERRVSCSENIYNQIFENSFSKLGLDERLVLTNGFLIIKEIENEESTNRDRHPLSDRVKEYFKSIRNQQPDHPALQHQALVTKLVGRAFIRSPFHIELSTWTLDKITNIQLPIELAEKFPDFSLQYHIHRFNPDPSGNMHFRVQLINASQSPLKNESSPQSPTLVSRCFFQSRIEVVPAGDHFFAPYRTRQEQNPIDEEARELEFQYKSQKSYSVGHNVASEWRFKSGTKNCDFVSTSWLPDTKVPSVRNDIEQTPDSEKVLFLRNLCPDGLSENELFKSLEAFAANYATWIDSQKSAILETEPEKQIAKTITERQEIILTRIQNGIKILKSNPNALSAFRISSLAMLIQMLVGRNEDFGGKEKDVENINPNVNFNDLHYLLSFEEKLPYERKPKYRPFQLAFLLLSIRGIVEPSSIDRQQIVDLIWFPTGGGKTEAYLALSSFVIVFRRSVNGKAGGGTTIVMRYTLRLLTAQQFERASRLICALEFLRNQSEYKTQLGNERITIGLWVGQSTTPNSIEQVSKCIDEMNKANNHNADPGEKNKFQVQSCPWCGTKTYSKKIGIAFEKDNNRLAINCLNDNCAFSEEYNGMPLLVFDEQIYNEPPTLLFGTVDKFAQLAWKNEAASLFGKSRGNLPPELVIQDELHLLSGPLGSMSGLFEFVVDELCSSGGVSPKIVASTATTRNTGNQVKALYGKHREVSVFPAPGLEYNDSYFAKTIPLADSLRQYVGIMPTGKTGLETQLQLLGTLLFARLEVLKEFSSIDSATQRELDKIIDPYWTVLSYFNSLRDVGITAGKVGDEVTRYTAAIQTRLPLEVYSKGKLAGYFNFNHYGLPERQIELTSRIDSSKIKGILNELEKKWSHDKLKESDGKLYLNEVIDLVLATNMISVGIDVGRLNLMLINGMPRSTSEYIQASSRIARQDPGMAILLVSPMKARERSLYEHFIGFHESFYKHVEPISATPFTEVTISKMSPTILSAWLRLVCGLAENELNEFDDTRIEPIIGKLCERFNNDNDSIDWLKKTFKGMSDSIKLTSVEGSTFKDKFKRPNEVGGNTGLPEDPTFLTLQSMREIAPEAWVRIGVKGSSLSLETESARY